MDRIKFLFGNKEKTNEMFRKNITDAVNANNNIPPEEKEHMIEEIIENERKKKQEARFSVTEDKPQEEEIQLADKTEKEDQFIYQIGQMKESKKCEMTWDDFAGIMNENLRPDDPQSESTWRKRYRRICSEYKSRGVTDAIMNTNPDGREEVVQQLCVEMKKHKLAARAERRAYSREVAKQSRNDEIIEMFREAIVALPKIKPELPAIKEPNNVALYAMVSDVHYGLSFDSYGGKYNTQIARERIMYYAAEIIRKARKENARTCYLTFMGDMISGNIHPGIRVENEEHVVSQIVSMMDIMSDFLAKLAPNFEHIYVNNVDGNHSRLNPDIEQCVRSEKLDVLIIKYAKAYLKNQDNIEFIENDIDSTIASYNIGKKLYIAVHGDLERDLKTTATAIEKATGKHIDYFLSAHMHVPELRAEDTFYIRNGSVCGSGDDYTMKKRLFSPASQVYMVVDDDGVRSIHVVNLEGVVA